MNIDSQLFGSKTRSRMLLCIADNEGASRKELARIAMTDEQQTSRLIKDFHRIGIVRYKISINASSVSLDDRFFAVNELRALLSVLLGKKLTNVRKSSSVVNRPASKSLQNLFGKKERGDVLLALKKFGTATCPQIASYTNQSERSVRSALDFLSKVSIVTNTQATSRAKAYSINDETQFADALKKLLQKILDEATSGKQ